MDSVYFEEPVGSRTGVMAQFTGRVQRTDNGDNTLTAECGDACFHVPVILAKTDDQVRKDMPFAEQAHRTAKRPPDRVPVKARAHGAEKVTGSRLDVELHFCNP